MYLIKTKFGILSITTSKQGVVKLCLKSKSKQKRGSISHPDKNTLLTISLLQRYFNGEKVEFDIKMDISNLSAFSRKVLRQTQKIPYGKTTTYGIIAKQIGQPKASRAVGRALGKNPIPVIIPCHRVIRKDNSLGGFAYGLSWKKRLLKIESWTK
jgi:methylated-DNA-[protein]-cysteine S-methyltransferase